MNWLTWRFLQLITCWHNVRRREEEEGGRGGSRQPERRRGESIAPSLFVTSLSVFPLSLHFLLLFTSSLGVFTLLIGQSSFPGIALIGCTNTARGMCVLAHPSILPLHLSIAETEKQTFWVVFSCSLWYLGRLLYMTFNLSTSKWCFFEFAISMHFLGEKPLLCPQPHESYGRKTGTH